MYNRYSVT